MVKVICINDDFIKQYSKFFLENNTQQIIVSGKLTDLVTGNYYYFDTKPNSINSCNIYTENGWF